MANVTCSSADGEKLLKGVVESEKPDLIGFNMHSTTYQTVLHMVRALREFYDGMIVLGGPHAIYIDKKVFNDCAEIDVLVLGEGERVLAEICRREKNDYDDIPGIVYRKNDRIKRNDPLIIRKKFGDYLFPDYRLFGVEKIYYPYPVATSRGCPFKCSFCNPMMTHRTWRPRPLDDVLDELEFAKEKFGISGFKLVEPVFNLKPRRVIEFCDGLMERGIDLPWFSASGLRADGITRETVRAIKRAGCTHVKIGVESLVPEVFEHIDKGESLESIIESIKMIKDEGLPLWGSFIIGLPYDTFERSMENLRLANALGFDFTEWSLLVPYPGTTAHEWMVKHGTIYHTIETAHQAAVDGLSDNEVHVACDTPEFPAEERRRAFHAINWKSGNYIITQKDSDAQNMIKIIKGILRYDPLRIPWHVRHILKMIKMRRQRRGGSGEMLEFHEKAFR